MKENNNKDINKDIMEILQDGMIDFQLKFGHKPNSINIGSKFLKMLEGYNKKKKNKLHNAFGMLVNYHPDKLDHLELLFDNKFKDENKPLKATYINNINDDQFIRVGDQPAMEIPVEHVAHPAVPAEAPNNRIDNRIRDHINHYVNVWPNNDNAPGGAVPDYNNYVLGGFAIPEEAPIGYFDHN